MFDVDINVIDQIVQTAADKLASIAAATSAAASRPTIDTTTATIAKARTSPTAQPSPASLLGNIPRLQQLLRLAPDRAVLPVAKSNNPSVIGAAFNATLRRSSNGPVDQSKPVFDVSIANLTAGSSPTSPRVIPWTAPPLPVTTLSSPRDANAPSFARPTAARLRSVSLELSIVHPDAALNQPAVLNSKFQNSLRLDAITLPNLLAAPGLVVVSPAQPDAFSARARASAKARRQQEAAGNAGAWQSSKNVKSGLFNPVVSDEEFLRRSGKPPL